MSWGRPYCTSSLQIRTLKHTEVRSFAPCSRKVADPDYKPRLLVCGLSIPCKLTTTFIPCSPWALLNSFEKHTGISTTIKRWVWKIHFTFIVIKQTDWESLKKIILTVRKSWKYSKLWWKYELPLIIPTNVNYYYYFNVFPLRFFLCIFMCIDYLRSLYSFMYLTIYVYVNIFYFISCYQYFLTY